MHWIITPVVGFFLTYMGIITYPGAAKSLGQLVSGLLWVTGGGSEAIATVTASSVFTVTLPAVTSTFSALSAASTSSSSSYVPWTVTETVTSFRRPTANVSPGAPVTAPESHEFSFSIIDLSVILGLSAVILGSFIVFCYSSYTLGDFLAPILGPLKLRTAAAYTQLSNKLVDAEATFKTALKADRTKMLAEIDRLTADLRASRDKELVLQANTDPVLRDTITTLRDEGDDLRMLRDLDAHTIKDRDAEVKALKGKVDDAEAHAERYRIERPQLRARENAALESERKATAEAVTLKGLVGMHARTAESNATTLSNERSEHAKTKEALAEANREKGDLRAAMAARDGLAEQHEGSQRALTEQAAKLMTSEEKLGAAEEEKASLKGSNAELEREVATLGRRSKEAVAASEKARGEMAEKLKAAEDEMADLKARVVALHGETVTLGERSENAQALAREVSEREEEKRKQMAGDLEAAQDSARERAALVVSLEKQISDAESRYDQASSSITSLKADLEKTRRELEEKEAQSSASQAGDHADQLKTQAEQHQAALDQLQRAHQELQTSHQELQTAHQQTLDNVQANLMLKTQHDKEMADLMQVADDQHTSVMNDYKKQAIADVERLKSEHETALTDGAATVSTIQSTMQDIINRTEKERDVALQAVQDGHKAWEDLKTHAEKDKSQALKNLREGADKFVERLKSEHQTALTDRATTISTIQSTMQDIINKTEKERDVALQAAQDVQKAWADLKTHADKDKAQALKDLKEGADTFVDCLAAEHATSLAKLETERDAATEENKCLHLMDEEREKLAPELKRLKDLKKELNDLKEDKHNRDKEIAALINKIKALQDPDMDQYAPWEKQYYHVRARYLRLEATRSAIQHQNSYSETHALRALSLQIEIQKLKAELTALKHEVKLLDDKKTEQLTKELNEAMGVTDDMDDTEDPEVNTATPDNDHDPADDMDALELDADENNESAANS